MKKPFLKSVCEEKPKGAKEKQIQKMFDFANIFSSLEYISEKPLYMTKASLLEASSYQPALQALRTHVCPRNEQSVRIDTSTNTNDAGPPKHTHSKASAPNHLLNMMVLSVYLSLADRDKDSNQIQFSKEESAALTASLEDIHPENEALEPDPSLLDSIQDLHSRSTNTIASNPLQTPITSQTLRHTTVLTLGSLQHSTPRPAPNSITITLSATRSSSHPPPPSPTASHHPPSIRLPSVSPVHTQPPTISPTHIPNPRSPTSSSTTLTNPSGGREFQHHNADH